MILKEYKSGSLGADQKFQNKTNPFLDDAGFYDISGFHYDEQGSITKWQGMTKHNSVELTGQTFTGLFDYSKSNGTRQQIGSSLVGMYRYDSPSANEWNAISLANCGGARTGTATDHFDSIILNDQFYLFNGIDQNVRYDGTTAYKMGIAAPTVTATETHVTAGTLDAVYGFQYLYTYYNTSLGLESNPNATLSTTTGVFTNQTVTVTVTCTDDPQVDRIRIYRTTDGGGLPLYCGYVANITGTGTTTFTDDNSDTSLGISIDYTGNGVPPIVKYADVYKGVGVYVPANSSRVWFSKSGKPTSVDSNDFRDLDVNDGTIITGLKRLYSLIVAFKEGSIWNGSGEDRDSFTFTRQVSDIGNIAPESVLVIPGTQTIMFLSKNGWYKYDGTSATYASQTIEKTFKALNQSRLSQVFGRVYKKRNILAWLCPNGTSVYNDLLITYDYVQDKWGSRSLSTINGNVLGILRDSNGDDNLCCGGYSGYVWTMDSGLSDNGTAIPCSVTDRAHPKLSTSSYSVLDMTKMLYQITVWFEPQSGTTITVSYCIDSPDGVYTTAGTIDAGSTIGQGHVRFNATGRRLFPKFTNTQTGQPLTIRGWQITYKILGRSA